MSPARRTLRRRTWPAHLYEPRPGYYVFRKPDGSSIALGRIPLPQAINETIAANRYLMETRPSLVAILSGETNTVADLVASIPPAEKRATRNTFRNLDKVIVEGALKDGKRAKGLGPVPCGQLTVKQCAELLDANSDRPHLASAVRIRLIAVCRKGMQKGWMTANPAEATEKPRADVSRGRLSLEQFLAIRAVAKPWLARAMDLALVTGQDRSTIAAMKRSDVKDGRLICQRSKTAAKAPPIAIPVALYLRAIDQSLDGLLKARTGIVSHYILHHTERQGKAAPGDPVGVNLITTAFTEARKLAAIPDAKAPTFHEIRSLAKRLYDAEGRVDTKTLLGHMTEAMAKLYASTRDRAPVEVRVINKK